MRFDLNHTQSHYFLPTYNNLHAQPEEDEDADQAIAVFSIAYTRTVINMMSYLEDTVIYDRSRLFVDCTLNAMHFYAIDRTLEVSWIVGDMMYNITFTNEIPPNSRAIPPHPHRLVLSHLDWNRNDQPQEVIFQHVVHHADMDVARVVLNRVDANANANRLRNVYIHNGVDAIEFVRNLAAQLDPEHVHNMFNELWDI